MLTFASSFFSLLDGVEQRRREIHLISFVKLFPYWRLSLGGRLDSVLSSAVDLLGRWLYWLGPDSSSDDPPLTHWLYYSQLRPSHVLLSFSASHINTNSAIQFVKWMMKNERPRRFPSSPHRRITTKRRRLSFVERNETVVLFTLATKHNITRPTRLYWLNHHHHPPTSPTEWRLIKY